MARSKATKVEKAHRVARFVQLIANGATTSDLVRYAADEWELSRRQTEKYIAEAREIIIADIDQDRRVVVAEMMSICRSVIKRGMQGQNYNAVLGAINSIRAMGGLDAGQMR